MGKSTCTNLLFSVLLSPALTPLLRLTPTRTTATTPPCTTPTPTGPACPPPSAPPPVSAAAARGPLTPRLMLTPTTATTPASTVTATPTPTVPASPATPVPPPASSPGLPRVLARGPLTLRPMLMLTTAIPTLTVTVMDIPTPVDTTVMPGDTTDTTIKQY